MNYLLERAGLTGQVALEFKSEPTEVLSALLADPSAVGVLPEPFKTAAIAKSGGKLSAPVSLTDVWDELAGDTGSRLLTGVTVVRRAFAEEHPEAVAEFLRCHAASVKAVNAAPGRLGAGRGRCWHRGQRQDCREGDSRVHACVPDGQGYEGGT